MSPAAALCALHVAVALFGFAGLFGKWLALPAVAIVLGRTLIASVTLFGIVRLQGGAGRPTRTLALNGVILAVHWASFFAAIQVSTVAVGLLGFASFPLFVLLLERRLLGRRASWPEAVTALLVSAGLVLLVPSFSLADRTVQGLGWGLLSGFTFAMLAVRNRDLARSHPPAVLALWQNAFAALCLAPVAVLWPEARWPTAQEWLLLAALGVVCTALAHTLFIASLRRLSAHTASIVSALEPVYGIALALLLLGEVPGPRTLVAAALIIAAAFIASRRAAG
jgi:drug/metabolite transporter (DMT)-like permease